jgi:hypothetical protein
LARISAATFNRRVADMRALLVGILASAIALVFVLASAADAKSRKHKKQAGARTVVTVYRAQRGANLFPPGPIFYGNDYLGEDPDPFIRQQIWRDLGAHFGGTD